MGVAGGWRGGGGVPLLGRPCPGLGGGGLLLTHSGAMTVRYAGCRLQEGC